MIKVKQTAGKARPETTFFTFVYSHCESTQKTLIMMLCGEVELGVSEQKYRLGTFDTI